MELLFLLEQVVNGLVLGGYYLLIALGLSLIFSVGGVVNLAHGAFYALGAYASLEIAKHLGFGAGGRPLAGRGGAARHPVRAVPAAPLLHRRSDPEPAADLRPRAWWPSRRSACLGRRAAAGVDARTASRGRSCWATSCSRAIACCCSPWWRVVLAGIWLLLHRTSFGRVVRAGIQRPDMVAALGIRLQPYMTAIVMLGVGMAALGGALFAPITVVHPAMGAEIITVAFVVVVIGGLGSFWGVVLAALLVGVVRGITIHFVPAAGEASMYVLMFLVLLFRPRGLLGERIEKFE